MYHLHHNYNTNPHDVLISYWNTFYNLHIVFKWCYVLTDDMFMKSTIKCLCLSIVKATSHLMNSTPIHQRKKRPNWAGQFETCN